GGRFSFLLLVSVSVSHCQRVYHALDSRLCRPPPCFHDTEAQTKPGQAQDETAQDVAEPVGTQIYSAETNGHRPSTQAQNDRQLGPPVPVAEHESVAQQSDADGAAHG